VCIVGCGYISRAHIEAYRSYGDVDLSLCDVDLEKAKAIGRQYGVDSFFQDHRKVLERDDIEIVDICLPNSLHEEVAVAALNAGKHVLLEKPIATTLSGADAIIAAAKVADGKFMVAESDRFVKASAKTDALIAEGAVGKVFWVQGNAFGTFEPSGWRLSKSMLGGGVLVEWGIHYVHTVNWLCGGEPQMVYARLHGNTYPEMEGEDTAFVMIEYASGITGQINVGYGVIGAPRPPHLMVCGSEGTLWQDRGLWLHRRVRLSDPPELILPESHYDDAVKAGIHHFLDCVRLDQEPLVSGELARRDLTVVMGAYRSSDEKRAIRL
jgi:predicted dehydrogenase